MEYYKDFGDYYDVMRGNADDEELTEVRAKEDEEDEEDENNNA